MTLRPAWNPAFQAVLSPTNWFSLFVTNAPAASFLVIDPLTTNSSAFYRALVGP